eukprot:m.99075 g.99075  ORF g.99075 m.99075 type:complete len:490 (+) comp18590_c0_seq4:353-1822(+)
MICLFETGQVQPTTSWFAVVGRFFFSICRHFLNLNSLSLSLFSGSFSMLPGKTTLLIAKLSRCVCAQRGIAALGQNIPALKPRKVFGWGSNDTGALSTAVNSTDAAPRALEGGEQPMHVAAGFGHSAVISRDAKSNKTELLVTGLNSSGQLGLGHYENVNSFQRVPFFDGHDLISVSCGRSHTVVITNQGVFGCGTNYHGQNGLGSMTKPSCHFEEVVSLRKVPMTEVACGWDHTLFLSQEGELFSCGWGADGQTGLGHTDCVRIPTRVGLPAAVESISSRADTCLAVCRLGTLHAWGNSEYGQTGLGTASPQILRPTLVKMPYRDPTVRAASAGSSSAVLTLEGNVFSFGLTAGVQQDSPTTVYFNDQVAISNIIPGGDFFAALSEHGRLFTWGGGRWGQLGHHIAPPSAQGTNDEPQSPVTPPPTAFSAAVISDTTETMIASLQPPAQPPQLAHRPTLVVLPAPVVAVACGFSHILALTQEDVPDVF